MDCVQYNAWCACVAESVGGQGEDIRRWTVSSITRGVRVFQNLSVAEIKTSEDGLDCVHAASHCETLFVLAQFEGERYHKLHRAEARIIGPPVILGCKRNKQVGGGLFYFILFFPFFFFSVLLTYMLCDCVVKHSEFISNNGKWRYTQIVIFIIMISKPSGSQCLGEGPKHTRF